MYGLLVLYPGFLFSCLHVTVYVVTLEQALEISPSKLNNENFPMIQISLSLQYMHIYIVMAPSGVLSHPHTCVRFSCDFLAIICIHVNKQCMHVHCCYRILDLVLPSLMTISVWLSYTGTHPMPVAMRLYSLQVALSLHPSD